MDLANYHDISPLERLLVDQIFGYLWPGLPWYVALLDHQQRWVLYRVDIRVSNGDTRLPRQSNQSKACYPRGKNLEKSALESMHVTFLYGLNSYFIATSTCFLLMPLL